MQFTWRDITDEDFLLVESWLDTETRYLTGLDDGWANYHRFYLNDENYSPGKDYWLKIISTEGDPIGIIALFISDNGVLTIPEYVIKHSERNKGIGCAVLRDLLDNTEKILGMNVSSAFAVIFPNNIQSQKAFEKAGFKFESAHPDGDAWYYRWKK